MSQETPQHQDRIATRPSVLWALSGCAVVAALHYFVDGRVPGGAVGGAIGGVLGGIVGLAVHSLRRK